MRMENANELKKSSCSDSEEKEEYRLIFSTTRSIECLTSGPGIIWKTFEIMVKMVPRIRCHLYLRRYLLRYFNAFIRCLVAQLELERNPEGIVRHWFAVSALRLRAGR